MQSGEIYLHSRFYADGETGELLPKYLLFIAQVPGGDWVVRLLTSRDHGRRKEPPCFHDVPYPGFFLGVLGGPLLRETWVDLRSNPDFDDADARGLISKGIMTLTARLAGARLRNALDCTAAAPDTTRQQEQAIRDELGRMPP